MKRLLSILILVAGCFTQLSAQGTGSIQGTVLDDKNEPIFNAVVEVYLGGVVKAGTVTDFDGNYVVKPLLTGRYDVKVKSLGFKDNIVTNVVVAPNKITEVKIKMQPDATHLQEVVVREYKVPLIDKFSGGNTTIKTSEEIERMPTRSAAKASDGTLYIIDGVQVYGSRGVKLKHNKRNQPKTIYSNPSTESYKKEPENDYKVASANPLSTMSVDVDRASYSNVRRFLQNGELPPADAVRIEEMINYFNYDYPQPEGDKPISIATEVTDCPWQPQHKLLHIGIQAKTMDVEILPASNLVFLIDVSGSMQDPNKLPLVIESLKLLTQNLRTKDKIAIVVYAGSAGMALPPTPGSNKQKISDALDRLTAGGSTAGGEGIKLAYKTAADNYIQGGNNRIILATDGDFNVGISGDNELEALITKEREKGIYLTCLGYGMGNYKDSKMEVLADKGNGNYAYIDNVEEAKKTLVKEFGGTVFTLAKDVKAQVEFNPALVQAYRLVGYENRLLNVEDFKDDKKDAGDMGSGHSVTVIYEIIPVGVKSDKIRSVNNLKYQHTSATQSLVAPSMLELATVKFRYKKPNGKTSMEISHVVNNTMRNIYQAGLNARFATSVAMMGMLLKNSEHKGTATYEKVLALGKSGKGNDEEGYREEYLKLVKQAKRLSGENLSHSKDAEDNAEIAGWFAEEQ